MSKAESKTTKKITKCFKSSSRSTGKCRKPSPKAKFKKNSIENRSNFSKGNSIPTNNKTNNCSSN